MAGLVRLENRQFSLLALFVLITCSGLGSWFFRAMTHRVQRTGLTAEQANTAIGQTYCHVTVPLAASDVNVDAHFQSAGADFHIERDEFLRWAAERGWTRDLLLFRDLTAREVYSFAPDWPSNVRNAYYFTNASHRGGWTVMYDLQGERAYVQYSAR
jgi:hypothetical protein